MSEPLRRLTRVLFGLSTLTQLGHGCSALRHLLLPAMEHPYADVFAALDDAGVDVVVVGGFAVIAHGHARLTVDADVIIDLAPHAALAAVEALLSLGLRPRLPVPAIDFADPEIRQGWIDERQLQVFTFHDPENPLRQVDVFAASPIPWAELLSDAVTIEVAGQELRVASIPHLIAMKEFADRPVDRQDIAALERLLEDRP